jgi:2-iminobutanoate/2-iminopropanoate deaminase
MMDMIETKNAPAPMGPYSQAIRANGFVFVSGQIAVCPGTGLIVEGGIEVQTLQVMKNLSAILKAADSGLDRVVKTTVFLSNLDNFSGFNGVYAECFENTRPARATVQVARLPKEALLEIEVIATA